jgi:hypothetical protein
MSLCVILTPQLKAFQGVISLQQIVSEPMVVCGKGGKVMKVSFADGAGTRSLSQMEQEQGPFRKWSGDGMCVLGAHTTILKKRPNKESFQWVLSSKKNDTAQCSHG